MHSYDFPLSPKARTYLKFEQVFLTAEECSEVKNNQEIFCLLRAVLDYIDLVDGAGTLKIELLKDLEKCDSRLREWFDDPEVDTDFVKQLRQEITKARTALDGFARQRTVLQSDPIISSIKPRYLTPCGVNDYDTPLCQFWLSMPREEHVKSVKKWLHEMDALRIPVYTVLYIWRLCAEHHKRVAKKGFMQEVADMCDLINIQYKDNVIGYPVVSGFQSRVNIHFMPYDKDASVGDIEFEISYIKSSLN